MGWCAIQIKVALGHLDPYSQSFLRLEPGSLYLQDTARIIQCPFHPMGGSRTPQSTGWEDKGGINRKRKLYTGTELMDGCRPSFTNQVIIEFIIVIMAVSFLGIGIVDIGNDHTGITPQEFL